jgi:hypothetical protein
MAGSEVDGGVVGGRQWLGKWVHLASSSSGSSSKLLLHEEGVTDDQTLSSDDDEGGWRWSAPASRDGKRRVRARASG